MGTTYALASRSLHIQPIACVAAPHTQTTNKNPMARYRRNFIAGGTFFFTVKLANLYRYKIV